MSCLSRKLKRRRINHEHTSNHLVIDPADFTSILDHSNRNNYQSILLNPSQLIGGQTTQIMRRNTNRLGMFGAGFAMALAGLMGTAQASQPLTVAQQNVRSSGEMKATRETRKSKEAININNEGGLDFNPFLFNDAGLSPKEYGLRFGTGKSRKGKSNRLRYSHNAKLKRRRAK